MEKLNLILLTKYGTSIKPWGNLHFALRLYVKRKVREVQSVPKRESNLAANGPWHQMKHLTNAAICLMFTLRHKIAPLQQNGGIIWPFTQWDCQAGGHQPGPYKDLIDLVLCVMWAPLKDQCHRAEHQGGHDADWHQRDPAPPEPGPGEGHDSH